jgi:hypothetical protein
MASEDKRKNMEICKCVYVVDGEACKKNGNGHQATVNAIAKKKFGCGNNKLIHATWGMIEREHTTMVSLLMHQPAFSNKK